MPIRFVYFDLGNVLLAFDRRRASENLSRLLGAPFDEVDELLHSTGLQVQFEHGTLTSLAYAKLICEALGQSNWLEQQQRADDQCIGGRMVCDAISDIFTPIESMHDVVIGTSQTVQGIGILSNTCSAHWEWIGRQAYPLMSAPFRHAVLSYEVGCMKPDRKIYEVAQELADCDASEILFLDDRAENVVAARDMGWLAEECVGGRQAAAALAKHGVITA